MRVILCQVMSDCENKPSGACGGCALKSHCTIVEDDRFTRRQRWKALSLGYIVPFVLLAAVIAVTDLLTDNEYLIGGLALATIAVYYLTLFFIKPKI